MIILYIFLGIVVVLAVLIARQVKIYNRADSIYYKPGAKEKLYEIYDAQLKDFPVPYEAQMIPTEYGKVHVLEAGDGKNPKLVMFHAASVGSVSWLKNVEELSREYHIYLIDTLGEGSRSELDSVDCYPQNSEEVAALYKEVFDKLNIKNANLAGASYGGFIALNFAYHCPEYINKIVLIGSMGIAPSVPKVIAKLTLYSFFPYRMLRNHMTKWAFGSGEGLENAKEYFAAVLDGVLGRYYAPATLPQDMLKKIKAPVLLMLGSRDCLVGDPQKAVEYTSYMESIQTEIFESGHLINMEKSDKVNKSIIKFVR